MLEHAAGQEDPRRMAVGRVEEVPVDPGDRRPGRDVFLDLGHAFAPAGHGVAAEHRGELVEAGRIGLRGGDDAEHDRPVRRELDGLLVGHARHQLDGACGLRGRRGQGRAKHK